MVLSDASTSADRQILPVRVARAQPELRFADRRRETPGACWAIIGILRVALKNGGAASRRCLADRDRRDGLYLSISLILLERSSIWNGLAIISILVPRKPDRAAAFSA